MLRLFAALAVFAMGAPSFAQNAPQEPAHQKGIPCDAFQHNPDGSWTPLKPVSLGGVHVGPGVSLREGVKFGGVDFAAELNKQCVAR
jgi:hypothetical protein